VQTAFAKYEGAGNDFILIDNREGGFTPRAELIAALCDRHFGIGADGLMTLARSAEIDCSMRYYNADGSEGEMRQRGALFRAVRRTPGHRRRNQILRRRRRASHGPYLPR
jgi:diaminopimelate epimerase